MTDIEQELREQFEEDEREVEFITNALPFELKNKFAHDDIMFMMDTIVDYYVKSGVLDAEPDKDGCIDLDMQKVAEYVCEKATEENKGPFDPDDVFFVVQADMDFMEQDS